MPPRYLLDALWPVPADGMFVRPEWPAIRQAIDADFASPDDRSAAWKSAVDRWIQLITDALNDLLSASRTTRFPYCISRSEHFTNVAPYAPDVAGEFTTVAEGFRTFARNVLTPRIATDPPAGCPIFIFHDRHVAQEYLRAFGTNAFFIAGVFFFEPPQHIVLNDDKRFHLRLTLIHELNHAALHALPIPLWLHEGLSRHFETKLLTLANMRFVNELDVGRTRFWQMNGLADFWSGAVFHDARAPHGYLLAHRFVRALLARNSESFPDFLLQAHKQDGGDAACQAIYGLPLAQLTRELLGQGDWPTPPVTTDSTLAPAPVPGNAPNKLPNNKL